MAKGLLEANFTSREPASDLDVDQQTYLRVAEQVLRDASMPLRVREIVERGTERGLFGDHTLGLTPEKSMQARLSMDILNRGERSRFVRVARGRFTLRSRVARDTESMRGTEQPLQEYIAERRVLRLPNEEVLCVPEHLYGSILTFQGIDTEAELLLPRLLAAKTPLYVPRTVAEDLNEAKQFVTYVLVQCGQRLLQFERSYLSRAAEFLRGAKCIGFGGHVTAGDADILSRDDLGVSTCARRELMEELRLESPGHEAASTPTSRAITPATVQLFEGATLEQLGVLNDDSSEVGRRHVAVVYRAWLPEWSVASRLAKGDSSIRSLNWLDVARDKVDLSEFEYWSQLCLRRFFPSNVISEAGIRILHPTRLKRSGALVVSGRIGSGKSETATYLATRLGTHVIRSSEVLQQLMGTRPLQEIGRKEFQDRAQQFISQVDGPAKLAAGIAEAVAHAEHDRCIVDGIRHLATYEHLSTALSDTTSLAYVQTPPDIAFDLYRSREATADLNFTYRDFLRFYDAPVESEITSLGRAADVYIYNSFGLEAFRRTLDEIVELLQENAE